MHERPSHAVPGYSLLFHAVETTEERKCPPLRLSYPCAGASALLPQLAVLHAGVCHSAVRQGCVKMLAKWFQSTRLETRTKESSIYASVWVWKPVTRNESKTACHLWHVVR